MAGARVNEEHQIRLSCLTVRSLNGILIESMTMQKGNSDGQAHPPAIVVTHLQGDMPHAEIHMGSWRQSHLLRTVG